MIITIMIILILAVLLGKVSEAHKKPGDQGTYVEDGDHYNQDDNHDYC